MKILFLTIVALFSCSGMKRKHMDSDSEMENVKHETSKKQYLNHRLKKEKYDAGLADLYHWCVENRPCDGSDSYEILTQEYDYKEIAENLNFSRKIFIIAGKQHPTPMSKNGVARLAKHGILRKETRYKEIKNTKPLQFNAAQYAVTYYTEDWSNVASISEKELVDKYDETGFYKVKIIAFKKFDDEEGYFIRWDDEHFGWAPSNLVFNIVRKSDVPSNPPRLYLPKYDSLMHMNKQKKFKPVQEAEFSQDVIQTWEFLAPKKKRLKQLPVTQEEKDEQKADIERYLLVIDRKLKSFDTQFLNKLLVKHSKCFGDTKEKPDWLSERLVYNDRRQLINALIAKKKPKNSNKSMSIKKRSQSEVVTRMKQVASAKPEVVTKMEQVASAKKLEETNWWVTLRPSWGNKSNEESDDGSSVYKISTKNRKSYAEHSLDVFLKSKIIRNYMDTSKQKNHK